jgi:rsbT co-antagonist protein RsbR
MAKQTSVIGQIISEDQDGFLSEWVDRQAASLGARREHATASQLREQSRRFLTALSEATLRGETDVRSAAYVPMRDLLSEISTERARQGYTPSETAIFVFSLKEPLFTRLRSRFAKDAAGLADASWEATQLLDALGLFTTEVYQKGREQIIIKQQEEMLELSTPVVTLWEGILALPLIGTLDSARTQVVMENLLQRVVETGSTLAIIDITGVPTVDTVTAQHLLKTVAAARLMGADCIISGIRPQIAQTIVHLGVELGDVVTKATLADAFAIALRRRGLAVQRRDASRAAAAVSKPAAAGNGSEAEE